MLNRMRWWSLLLGVLLISAPARAQTGAFVRLHPPKTDAYPLIETYLDLHAAGGEFIHSLQPDSIRILENGASVPVTSLEEIYPGLQLTIAINPGQSFSIRSSQGISRYEAASGYVRDWAASRLGSSIDDLSLLVSAGPEATHITDSGIIIQALDNYTYTETTQAPSLDLLSRAVDVVSDVSPRQGMERAILFITAPMQGDIRIGLQTLAARLQAQVIHLFVVYVTPAQLFETPEALLLNELALQTGGQFFPYSGEETLPNLETYLDELRDIYHLTFKSQARQGGTQTLLAEVLLDGETIQSPQLAYELNLLKPDLAFIQPAAEIVRQPPEALRGNLWEAAAASDLLPVEHALQILVDFPDGRLRPLESTSLFVDGVKVAENRQAPFDRFTWDLSGIVTSGQHILRVEAVDAFGLTGSSIETPIQVQVILPNPNPLRALAQRWPAMAALFGVLLAAILLLGLLLGEKINPGWRRLGQAVRRSRVPEAAPQPDSLPAEAQTPERRHLPEWVNRFHWPQRRMNPRAFAYLVPVLDVDDEGSPPGPISITADEVTLGSDPQRATLVLAEPSVGALHARMVRRESGDFSLKDEGSVAGTWVNYNPIPPEGITLEHGDMIHLGRVCMRFNQREPQRERKVTYTLQEPEL